MLKTLHDLEIEEAEVKEKEKIPGVKNENKLKEFNKALPTIFAASDTRKVVNAASAGKLGDYEAAIKAFKIKGTRDYNIALIILSPIVAAARAIMNNADVEDAKTGKKKGYLDETHSYLYDLLSAVMKDRNLKHLFLDLGDPYYLGSTKHIQLTLNRFLNYQNLLYNLSGGKYGRPNDEFIKRTGEMTSWIINRKYVNDKLLKFVSDTFDSDLSAKLKSGLSKEDKTPHLPENWDADKIVEEDEKAIPHINPEKSQSTWRRKLYNFILDGYQSNLQQKINYETYKILTMSMDEIKEYMKDKRKIVTPIITITNPLIEDLEDLGENPHLKNDRFIPDTIRNSFLEPYYYGVAIAKIFKTATMALITHMLPLDELKFLGVLEKVSNNVSWYTFVKRHMESIHYPSKEDLKELISIIDKYC